MITKYEIENVYLAQQFSKARKLAAIEQLELTATLRKEIEKDILDGETKKKVTDRAEADDRMHWITYYGKMAACDLLTLGKVQPETMLSMALLPVEDFKEAVKVATKTARQLDKDTVDAEAQLNLNSIPDELV